MGAFNCGQRPGLRRRGACVEMWARNAKGGVAIIDQTPGTGDQRPVSMRPDDRPTSPAFGTVDVCSNTAVNSGRSCLLYRGRLSRAEAVV